MRKFAASRLSVIELEKLVNLAEPSIPHDKSLKTSKVTARLKPRLQVCEYGPLGLVRLIQAASCNKCDIYYQLQTRSRLT